MDTNNHEQNSPPPTAPAWFKRVPWYVSVPVVIGGWCLSAFSGALSQRWQIFGFCVGVVFIILGCIAYALHDTWKATIEKRKAVPKIAVILCIGGACLISFFKFASDPRVALFDDGKAAVVATVPAVNLNRPVTTNDASLCPDNFSKIIRSTMGNAMYGNIHVGCHAKVCVIDSTLENAGMYNYVQADCPN